MASKENKSGSKRPKADIRLALSNETVSVHTDHSERVERILTRARRDVASRDIIDFLFVRIWQVLARLGVVASLSQGKGPKKHQMLSLSSLMAQVQPEKA